LGVAEGIDRNQPDHPMNVRVQFYSHVGDLAGASELYVELADRATVGDLLATIYERTPALRSRDKSILIGAGVEFVDRNYELKPSEEISIMPPVQGG
jgi:molybdopterin converting factor small subunit